MPDSLFLPLHRTTGPRGSNVRYNHLLIMEQINRIEVRGLVGMVKLQEVGERKVARFTVATSYAYEKGGSAVIDTQWHNVSAWEGKNINCIDKLKKGDKVYVLGRIKYPKFTGSDGVERTISEIQASKVSIIDDDDVMQCEM